MFDLEKISLTRFHLVYYFSFAIVTILVALLSRSLLEGYFSASVVILFFNEMRVIFVREKLFPDILVKIFQNRALFQLFLMAVEFAILVFLLLYAVIIKVTPAFFLGFFIAYFTNLIILVLSSRVR